MPPFSTIYNLLPSRGVYFFKYNLSIKNGGFLKNRRDEKWIEKEILMYLHRRGIFCWKQNTVGVYDEKKGVYRRPNSPFIISGVSDILAISDKYHGKLITIEVKTPERRNNLTTYQKEFMENIKKHGGIAFVACSIEDVEENLKAANVL